MLPTDSTSSRTGTDLTQRADNPLAKQCGLCVPWDPPPVGLLLLLLLLWGLGCLRLLSKPHYFSLNYSF